MSKETLNNGTTVTITNSVMNRFYDRVNLVDWRMRNIEDVGDRKSFNSFFRIKKNKPTKVGEMLVEAPSGKKFSKTPSLVRKQRQNASKRSKLSLKVTSVTKDDNGNNIAYNFDMIYVAKESVTKSSLLGYKIQSDIDDIVAPVNCLSRFSCGKGYRLGIAGDRRKLVAYGTPGLNVHIVVLKVTKNIDSEFPDKVANTTFESIVKKPTVRGNPTDETAIFPSISYTVKPWGSYDLITGKIQENGKLEVWQNFPKQSDETDYYVGIRQEQGYYCDRFVGNSLTNTRGESQNSLSSSYIQLDLWSGWYFKKLTQFKNSNLTLRLTTTLGAGLISVDSNGDGTYETFNSSSPIDIVKRGYVNTAGTKSMLFDVTYVVKAISGQFRKISGAGGEISFTNLENFTESTNNVQGDPVFSNETQTDSDWTNSVSDNNKGTILSIYNISNTLSDNNWDGNGDGHMDTSTIKFTVRVDRFGSKDVTMALNLNSAIERF
jgi:hypothetical protein